MIHGKMPRENSVGYSYRFLPVQYAADVLNLGIGFATKPEVSGTLPPDRHLPTY